MANCKLVAVVSTFVILLILEVSTCSEARHHALPDPCSGEDGSISPDPGTLHKHRKPGHCPGTPGVMTVNGWEEGEGSHFATCDGQYHSDRDMTIALSTRWYAGGRRCHKPIRITSKHNGRTVEAIVVDECDSRLGCKDNILVTSQAVWKALGLDSNVGEEPVTWSDA